MKFNTILLAAAVLSAPVPGAFDALKTGAKNVGKALWTGTKVATLGLVGGSAVVLGAVGTNRLLHRKKSTEQPAQPAQAQQPPAPPMPIATDAQVQPVSEPVVQ